MAVKARRVVTSPRRRTRFVQSPDDPGSALFASGTDEDLRAYLRTVAAQPS